MSMDIMTATKEDLTRIPGVHEALAHAIVEYRQRNPIFTWDDLRQVPGMTYEIVEKLKNGGMEIGTEI